jgi:hypothetical protein
MLTSELESSAPVAVLRLRGELAMAGSVDARAAMSGCLAAQPAAVVIDLTGAVLVDDITLTAFSAFARAADDWPGCPVYLCTADPTLRDGLHRLAVTPRIPVLPTRAEALAAAAAVPVPQQLRQTLEPHPAALTQARQLVRAACAGWELAQQSDEAELIVTELVSNVIRHVGEPMELTLTRRERLLRIAVRDSSSAKPVRVLPEPDAGHGGRGLLLLDAIAAGWGSVELAHGKVVWATLPTRRRIPTHPEG